MFKILDTSEGKSFKKFKYINYIYTYRLSVLLFRLNGTSCILTYRVVVLAFTMIASVFVSGNPVDEMIVAQR